MSGRTGCRPSPKADRVARSLTPAAAHAAGARRRLGRGRQDPRVDPSVYGEDPQTSDQAGAYASGRSWPACKKNGVGFGKRYGWQRRPKRLRQDVRVSSDEAASEDEIPSPRRDAAASTRDRAQSARRRAARRLIIAEFAGSHQPQHPPDRRLEGVLAQAVGGRHRRDRQHRAHRSRRRVARRVRSRDAVQRAGRQEHPLGRHRWVRKRDRRAGEVHAEAGDCL